jgi:tetratricopeptide (TPR) repeat protein
MTYEESRRAFETVAVADPGCAMARWGIAMSLFQPLWPNRPDEEALRRGREAVEAAAALAPPTERERLYVAAAAEFFREPGPTDGPTDGSTDGSTDYWARIGRWQAAQEALFRAYPEDLDAAAFHALALLATTPGAERPIALHERAAEILQRILGSEPRHPGAVHYTIHANDIAGREAEALDVVRSYADIAPHNPHALHMPTHIFVRLGLWQEVIDWNRQAAEAALGHSAGEHGEHTSDEYPHALEYLVYAALQQGDEAAATEVWQRLRRATNLQPTFKSAFHLASIPARIAVERQAWDEAAALVPRQPAWVEWDRFPWAEAVSWFTRGLGSARRGDLAAARDAAGNLARLRDRAAAAGEAAFAREIEILDLELAAWIALAQGDPSAARRLLAGAVDLERATPKHPVTPAPLLPAREQLADLLLATGHVEEAMESYRAALREAPNRRLSLLGLAEAGRRIENGSVSP